MPSPSKADRVDEIRRRLLEHFDREKRDLPWRGETDAYRVWVSEVMLQQTRVETVVPYYRRWLERFPDVAALAAAERGEVLRAWEGLGYYSRARNLHEAARIVADRLDGALPGTAAALRELPGIGDYTAGAVASIAFGRAEPAVDGNARRVLARLFDLEAPTTADLQGLAARLVPEERPGDFNQAVMELGATLCSPRSPACGACPVEAACLARERGTVEERPRPARRPPVPAYDVGVAVVVSPAGRALVARRPEAGMLGGMWEFPGRIAAAGAGHRETAAGVAAALLGGGGGADGPGGGGAGGAGGPGGGGGANGPEPVRRIDRVEHIYSHRRHTYHAWLFRSSGRHPDVRAAARREGWSDAAWVDAEGLAGLAVPAAQRKIARAFAGVTA